MQDVDDEPLGVARVDFSDAEEQGLQRLASALQLVGLLQILLAGIAVVLALFGVLMSLRFVSPTLLIVTLLSLAYVALPIWQGLMMREAGESLGRVAASDEDDQEYIASAFRRLRVVFMIEFGLAVYTAYQTFM